MYWKHAELKCSVSKSDFLHLYQTLLEQDKKTLDMEMKEQIVYFADNTSLDYYKKNQIAVRYRWNNRGLEVIVKKRWLTVKKFEKIEKQFWCLSHHELKIDVDQISTKTKTISCVLKYTYNSIHQSFAFFKSPVELLSDVQKEFIWEFTDHEIEWLRFLIPIQSKTFIFPCEYKEFELISLEERRVPKLFWNRFYEITFKTSNYNKNTVRHFIKLCEKYNIPLHWEWEYKTQWLYDAYFNV